MGGFASVFRGALAGLNEAAGNPGVAQNLERQNAAARQAKQQQLQMQVVPHGVAIKGIQERIKALDTTDPHYADMKSALTAEMARHISGINDLLYPEKDPNPKGNVFQRDFMDKLHLTSIKNRDKRQADIQKKTEGIHGKREGQSQESAQSIAEGTVPYTQDPKYVAASAMDKQHTEAASAQEDKHLAGQKQLEQMRLDQKAVGGKPDVQALTLKDGKQISVQWSPEGKKWQYLSGEDVPSELLGGATVSAKPTKQNRDDKYIAIEQKKAGGQPLTEDDKAYSSAYDVWTQKTKVIPGVARAVAFGANRYIPVLDPQDPENVTFMRAGDAAASHASSPQGIAFQTDKALTRAFTSGQPAQTINYFNTATEHLQQLQQAADALKNGDMQLFNKWGNAWATASGNPAPTNFATIRNAVAGELSKTFKGAAATDAEIDAINTSINSSQSPEQLSGAIQNNIHLMGSKMGALRGQYEQGKEGKPNFPGAKTAQLQSMRTPQGATGTVKYQGKTYWVDKGGNNLGEKN